MFSVLAIASLFLQPASASEFRNPSPYPQSANFNMTERAAKFRNELEDLYKTTIRVTQEQLPIGMAGNSLVDQDGSPHALVSSDLGGSELEHAILHELHHLKLRIDGYPRFFLPSSQPLSDSISTNVFSQLQHMIFYPDLQAIGFTPNILEIEGAKIRLDYPVGDSAPIEATSADEMALYMFAEELQLRFGNSAEGVALLEQLQKRYTDLKRSDVDEALSNARRTVMIVREAEIPKTPAQFTVLATRVLNCLLPHRGTFTVQDLPVVPYPTWKQQMVVMSVDDSKLPECR